MKQKSRFKNQIKFKKGKKLTQRNLKPNNKMLNNRCRMKVTMNRMNKIQIKES